MKTMSKKIASILLALCLCFSLVGTALAATSSDADSFTITVNGAAVGETYSAYKIFDVTYDTDAEAYSYTIDYFSAWYNTVSAATDVFTLTQINNSTTYLVTVNAGVEDDAIIAVFTAVPQGAVADASSEATSDTVVLDVTNSGPGYYYVTTSLGSLVIIDTTNPDAEVEEKNGTPTISKWVYNNGTKSHEDDENQGATVSYELDVEHITGAVNLVIHDSMMSELVETWDTFSLERVVIVDSETDETLATLIQGTDYTLRLTGAVSENCSDPECSINGEDYAGCTFEIDFTDYDFSSFDDNAVIEVFYDADLNTESDLYTDDFDEIDNWAMVTFGSGSESTVVEAEVYSFGFEVFKYTDASSAYGEVIVASFSNDNPNTGMNPDDLYLMCVDADGNATAYATFEPIDEDNYIYYITGWVDTEEEASSITEPDDDAGEQTAYFFVPNSMTIPAHLEIQLDEDPSNPQQETNAGAEIFSASGYDLPLAGAQFEVTNEAGQTAYFLYEDEQNVYLFEGWLNPGETAPAGYDTSLASGTDGMIYIEGLNTGTYYVTETVAPDGYNLLTGSITVNIIATYNEETGAIVTHTVTYSYGETSGEGVVEVLNNTGSKLPSTGGIGTTIFYIIGGILVVGAVVVLVTRRRMTSES